MGLPDRVSQWAREATKRRNANVGAGERVELDQLVGKYSRYRNVIHDRRLVFTEKAAYFLEADGTQPTEVLPWSKVMLVELARSVTGTCVLDILLSEGVWGMRTVSCDFYAAEDETWGMWTSSLSVAKQEHRFRFEVSDAYAAGNCMNVGSEMGSESGDFGKIVSSAAFQDDLRATMNWLRMWSHPTKSSAKELPGDEGFYSNPKLCGRTTSISARSASVSTVTLSPCMRTRMYQGDLPNTLREAPHLALGKASANSDSANGMNSDSRSTSASDVPSVAAAAHAEASLSRTDDRFVIEQ
jgi:hypothetical protein